MVHFPAEHVLPPGQVFFGQKLPHVSLSPPHVPAGQLGWQQLPLLQVPVLSHTGPLILLKVQFPPVEQVPDSHGLLDLQSELVRHSTHWKLLLHFVPPVHVPQLPPLPQPLSPQRLPSHCGSHAQLPLEHLPGLLPDAVHIVPFEALAVPQRLLLQVPTLQPSVRSLQSAGASHCTH
jgi:hypothetical protein